MQFYSHTIPNLFVCHASTYFCKVTDSREAGGDGGEDRGGREKGAGRDRGAEAEGEDGGGSGGEPTVGDRGGGGGRQAETEAGNSQAPAGRGQTGTCSEDTRETDPGRERSDQHAEELGSCPHQPNSCFIQTQSLTKKTLKFQDSWFRKHTWLHYSKALKGVLCFYCAKYFAIQKSSLASKADGAFITTGFSNWKKALEKFHQHENSDCHAAAMTTYLHSKQPITTQLSTQLQKQQHEARNSLLKIVGGIMYLARQGNAFRGHDSKEGNLHQLMIYKAEDDAEFNSWLQRGNNFTSPKILNEIIKIIGNKIVYDIVKEILSLPLIQYSLIIDGTQDAAGVEQESFCLRFIDKNLQPREEFIGLYQVTSTTGENIASAAKDVLLRLNLPLSQLRGQAYDGAANMSGRMQGVQAHLKKEQPLAVYVHCGPHCINLITQAACASSTIIRDAIHLVHELGVLFHQSMKFRAIFATIAKSDHTAPYTSLKPLCPTRWTVRTPAIRSVLNQYHSVLAATEEMAQSSMMDVAAKASGLHEKFLRGNTLLGLLLAEDVMSMLEELNISLQQRRQTTSGMLAAVEHVKRGIQEKRSEGHFGQLHMRASQVVTSVSLQPIKMPHVRMPPKRFTGPAMQHQHHTAQDYYRVQYFGTLDTVVTQCSERFSQEGLQRLQKLENIVITGKMDTLINEYPELDAMSLDIQLKMFKANYPSTSLSEVAEILKGMTPEVRHLFREVEALLRLVMVVPASAEAERSFSALRRLKTWLRTSMTQTRLNNLAVCHVHQDKLDALDRRQICQRFVEMNGERLRTFGAFI
ncbi:zinc finger MYM-type protein 1-like isoform X1 [Eleginops maclovinus]